MTSRQARFIVAFAFAVCLVGCKRGSIDIGRAEAAAPVPQAKAVPADPALPAQPKEPIKVLSKDPVADKLLEMLEASKESVTKNAAAGPLKETLNAVKLKGVKPATAMKCYGGASPPAPALVGAALRGCTRDVSYESVELVGQYDRYAMGSKSFVDWSGVAGHTQPRVGPDGTGIVTSWFFLLRQDPEEFKGRKPHPAP